MEELFEKVGLEGLGEKFMDVVSKSPMNTNPEIGKTLIAFGGLCVLCGTGLCIKG